jgi:hypothetical protein
MLNYLKIRIINLMIIEGKMTFTKSVVQFLLLTILSSQNILAGQGKDGTWPKSFKVLNSIIVDLHKQLATLTDEDVKFALHGLKDRQEYIKVESLDAKKLKKIAKAIQKPDVEAIEKQNYFGVKLFSYDNSNPDSPEVFATKNFFNNPRYQVELKDINLNLKIEVQFMLLREISHLWGFGEDGAVNYASIFAKRMIQLIYNISTPISQIYTKIQNIYNHAAQLQGLELQVMSKYNAQYYCYNINNKKIYPSATYSLVNLTHLNLVYFNNLYDSINAELTILIGKNKSEYIACHHNQQYLENFLAQF